MKIITRKGLAKAAASRWKSSYYKQNEWKYGEDKEQKYYKLVALGGDPSPHDVDSVIGNTSWTDLRCDECGHAVHSAMRVGEEPDYESSTALVCQPCLLKALEEIK